MTNKYWIFALLILSLLAAVVLAQPVSASPQPQVVYQTPTPLPDGRILYTVQEKDTCLRIELLTGVTVAQLQALNGLDSSCTLSVGKQLLLSVVAQVPTQTPNPDFTPTPLLPTPTPFLGFGKLCIQLYNDINGNGFQDDNEFLLAGGAASITARKGDVSETGLTVADAIEPYCIEVPDGEYNISIAVPDGYNATTETALLIPVQAGNHGFVDFGAQVSANAAENNAVSPEQPAAPAGGNNLMLALVGGLLLVLGVGLGGYVLVMRR